MPSHFQQIKLSDTSVSIVLSKHSLFFLHVAYIGGLLFHLKYQMTKSIGIPIVKRMVINRCKYYGLFSIWTPPPPLKNKNKSNFIEENVTEIIICKLLSAILFRGHALTHWGRDKMEAISQTTYSNAFSWLRMYEFRLKFHWSLFPRIQLTIFHFWFR